MHVDEYYSSDSFLLESERATFFIVTNKDAPNQKLIKAKANNPRENYLVVVISETENVLSVSSGGGYFFANYIVDIVTKVVQYHMQGNILGEIELPGLGTSKGFNGGKDDKILYYSFTNYQSPGVLYSY